MAQREQRERRRGRQRKVEAVKWADWNKVLSDPEAGNARDRLVNAGVSDSILENYICSAPTSTVNHIPYLVSNVRARLRRLARGLVQEAKALENVNFIGNIERLRETAKTLVDMEQTGRLRGKHRRSPLTGHLLQMMAEVFVRADGKGYFDRELNTLLYYSFVCAGIPENENPARDGLGLWLSTLRSRYRKEFENFVLHFACSRHIACDSEKHKVAVDLVMAGRTEEAWEAACSIPGMENLMQFMECNRKVHAPQRRRLASRLVH